MLNTPIVRFLLTLKHDPKTNISAGFINNMDAVALFIYTNGATDPKQLAEFSQAWRGSNTLKYCFVPHNGCIAINYYSPKIFCGNFGPCSGAPKPGTQLWYREQPYTETHAKRSPLIHRLTKRGEDRCTQLLEEAAL